jgi:hypothetical protein
MIYYWIIETKKQQHQQQQEEGEGYIMEGDFKKYLEYVRDHCTETTNLVEKGLFRHYYNNEDIFCANAKESFVQPTKLDFPVW